MAAPFFYHALVLAIETSPIIAKTPKGEYDYKLILKPR
jgi:hypothetical protein